MGPAALVAIPCSPTTSPPHEPRVPGMVRMSQVVRVAIPCSTTYFHPEVTMPTKPSQCAIGHGMLRSRIPGLWGPPTSTRVLDLHCPLVPRLPVLIQMGPAVRVAIPRPTTSLHPQVTMPVKQSRCALGHGTHRSRNLGLRDAPMLTPYLHPEVTMQVQPSRCAIGHGMHRSHKGAMPTRVIDLHCLLEPLLPVLIQMDPQARVAMPRPTT
jgi:hypothetical protein